mgnify:FL=1
MKGGDLLNNYKILRFDGKKQYTEVKEREKAKEYLNTYIDEDVNEILFIIPMEKNKKKPTIIEE